MSNETGTDGKLKLNYPKTILAGGAFLGVNMAWTIYSPYMTKILQRFLSASAMVSGWSERLAGSRLLEQYITSQGDSAVNAAGAFTVVPLLIGVIMTFNYVLGVVFQPIFGRVSDGWHSRLGRRKPFILLLMPISAVLFAMLPLMASLTGLITCILAFSFVMAIYRSPTMSIMPDITPSELRSSGNAVISLMGGVGSIIGMAAGTLINLVYTKARGIPAGQFDEFTTFPHVFILGAVVMVLCTLSLFFIREQDTRLVTRKAEKEARQAAKLNRSERTSLLFMLAGLFFVFCGTNVIQTFFALFAEEILHKNTAFATILMALFAVCAAGGAVPAGALGRKFGRRKTILGGLVIFLVVFAGFLAVFFALLRAKGLGLSEFLSLNQSNPEGEAVAGVVNFLNVLIYPVMVVAGFASMMIMVNAMPLVVEFGGSQRVGVFTGYYYVATNMASVASPITYGFFRIFSGSYISLFYYSPIMFVIAAALIFFVRHGEAVKAQAAEA